MFYTRVKTPQARTRTQPKSLYNQIFIKGSSNYNCLTPQHINYLNVVPIDIYIYQSQYCFWCSTYCVADVAIIFYINLYSRVYFRIHGLFCLRQAGKRIYILLYIYKTIPDYWMVQPGSAWVYYWIPANVSVGAKFL